jgi:hypothetical protein
MEAEPVWMEHISLCDAATLRHSPQKPGLTQKFTPDVYNQCWTI